MVPYDANKLFAQYRFKIFFSNKKLFEYTCYVVVEKTNVLS